jgi:hypothetical protein
MPSTEPLQIPDKLRIRFGDGRIEELLVDEYLKGVVPTEIGLNKPLEALKAQAIAARSYAVVGRRHARDGFDLCTTQHCQVWKPENRYARSDHAIDETSGLVISYQNRIVATHFFGHCDGHTKNSEDVWSGKVAYLRRVPCICGYDKLWGHGVGMCQRGATAMAKEGATAEEILKHYYSGIAIATATVVPRSSMRQSMILGQVVDGRGKPRKGFSLILTGPEGAIGRSTTADGRFWCSKLPAGLWEVRVKGRPVRYRDLRTDGRNIIHLPVVVPDAPPLEAHMMPVAHPRQLIGTVGYSGLQVTIIDPEGRVQRLFSGSADLYNPGGFAVPLEMGGSHTVQFLERSFDLPASETGLWVRFVPREGS